MVFAECNPLEGFLCGEIELWEKSDGSSTRVQPMFKKQGITYQMTWGHHTTFMESVEFNRPTYHVGSPEGTNEIEGRGH